MPFILRRYFEGFDENLIRTGVFQVVVNWSKLVCVGLSWFELV